MIFTCCKTVLRDLIFHPDCVAYCCAKITDEILCYNQFDGKIITKEDYLERRNKLIDRFKNGDIPAECRKCHNLETKEWDESAGINIISLAHKTKCSICNCVYCTLSCGGNQEIKKRENERIVYDIMPILNQFKKDNLILDDCAIGVSGGECTEYPNNELENLTAFAIENHYQIEYLTSAVKYSECIASALKTNPSKLIVSVDSGTQEMFERIKRVKAYDVVWENLKKYIASAADNDKANVFVKYIIIPGVNDSVEELTAFFKKCRSIKCKKVLIDIEFSWFAKNQYNKAEGSLKEALKFINMAKNIYAHRMYVSYSVDCEFWCKKQTE